MVDSAARPADGAVSFSSRLAARRTIALVLVPFLLVAAVGLARGGLAPTRPNLVALTGGATNLAPPQLTRAAAEVLERALAKGGGGITFEIVQTSTITARRGGPLVEIPDPADRTKSLGAAERYVVGTLIERGVATPDGYWMELLYGPEPGAEVGFDVATAQRSRQDRRQLHDLGHHHSDRLDQLYRCRDRRRCLQPHDHLRL